MCSELYPWGMEHELCKGHFNFSGLLSNLCNLIALQLKIWFQYMKLKLLDLNFQNMIQLPRNETQAPRIQFSLEPNCMLLSLELHSHITFFQHVVFAFLHNKMEGNICVYF